MFRVHKMKKIILLILALFILTACGGEVTVNRIATFETSEGTFKVELFEDKMPITAGNFAKLVEEGFYDGIKFHRVIENFMIQAGDPLTKDDSKKDVWGTGSPGYTIKDEFVSGLSNIKGTLSMANSGPNSGGSQFFINLNDNTFLDFDKEPAASKHPVFGKVVEGYDIVRKISIVKKNAQDQPIEDVIIVKLTLEG